MSKRLQSFLNLFLIFILWLTIFATSAATAVAQEQPEICTEPFLPVSTPLTDLGAAEYVRMDGQVTGFSGGLYPDGRNSRPPDHEAAGLATAQNIVPLDENGQPDRQNGKIGMISVGMSNTSSEFNTFIDLIHRNPEVNNQVVAVNGAQGGRVANHWSADETDVWDNLAGALNHRKLSPAQVQVAWIKLTLTRPGEFPDKAEELQGHLEIIVQKLKQRFPNLQIIYLSSRTRSYTYNRGLSPEPVAFETGFAVKWLIEKQINGDPALNFDPEKGEVQAPFLSWGPYLWIDGENERSDGRVWLAEDMTRDCTHPSPSGNQKVAGMLLEFFLTDSTTAWFRASYTPEDLPVNVAEPTETSTATTTAPAPTATSTATSEPAATATMMPTPTATAVAEVAAAVAPAPTSTPAPETAVEPPTAAATWLWPVITVLALLIGTAVGWFWRGRQE